MKIKLFCSAGMSTSMMVKKMEVEAKKRGLECEIAAYPESTLELEISNGCDVALLGPQVSYMLKKAKNTCEPKGVPVDVIPMQLYGIMDGGKVLDFAINLKKNL